MGLHLLLLLLSPVLLHISFNILYTCSHSLLSSHTQSWEGEEKQELKEVVSEPTTPPLATDDSKPDPVSLAPYSSNSRFIPHTAKNDSITIIPTCTCTWCNCSSQMK